MTRTNPQVSQYPVYMEQDYTPLVDLIAGLEGPLLFVNVGAACVTGDSFGPALGTMLLEADAEKFTGVAVLGTLDAPVQRDTLPETHALARRKFKRHLCFATDAALGAPQDVGWISVANKPLVPGAGTDKREPEIGDYSLLACVDVRGLAFQAYDILENTRRDVVEGLARRTADAILAGLEVRQARQQVAAG